MGKKKYKKVSTISEWVGESTVPLRQLEAYAQRNPKGKGKHFISKDVAVSTQNNDSVYISVSNDPKPISLTQEEYWRPIWAYREKRLYIIAGNSLNGYKAEKRINTISGSIRFRDIELSKKIKGLPNWRFEAVWHIDEGNNMAYIDVPFER